MKSFFGRFIREDDGQDLIEYALLAALIAVAVSAAMTGLAGALNTRFNQVAVSVGS